MRNMKWYGFIVLLAIPLVAGAGSVYLAANGEPGDPGEAPVVMWSGDEAVAYSGSRSYLGVDITDVTAERARELKLKEERGVEITLVDQDAPAGKAGLKSHDVILEFNGARVESTETLRRMIHETPPGRTVKLGIVREGQPLTLSVTLAERNQYISMAPKVKVRVPKPPRVVIPKFDVVVRTSSTRNGLVVENLTHQLGEFFGVKDGKGVLVRSVEKGSPGEAAGVRAGDVIVKVENATIGDTGDWRSAMRRKSGKVALGIVRDKREQSISLSLPESKDEDSSYFFEMPDFDWGDFGKEMEDLKIELNRLGPEMDRARRQAHAGARREVEKARQEMERLRPEMERAHKEARDNVRREMERLHKELQELHVRRVTVGEI